MHLFAKILIFFFVVGALIILSFLIGYLSIKVIDYSIRDKQIELMEEEGCQEINKSSMIVLDEHELPIYLN